MTLDLDAIAREACLAVCRKLGWPETEAPFINLSSPHFAKAFAALLLEKAAQVCDGRESMDADWCAQDIRAMAAGMGE